ncbi:hypothetical protein ACQP3J_33295, partial [Escherichia coli]
HWAGLAAERRVLCSIALVNMSGERVESTQAHWTLEATQEKTNAFCTCQWEILINCWMEVKMVRAD